MTRIIVVRYRQSETNISKVFTEQLNTNLSELGIEQAKKLEYT